MVPDGQNDAGDDVFPGCRRGLSERRLKLRVYPRWLS